MKMTTLVIALSSLLLANSVFAYQFKVLNATTKGAALQFSYKVCGQVPNKYPDTTCTGELNGSIDSKSYININLQDDSKSISKWIDVSKAEASKDGKVIAKSEFNQSCTSRGMGDVMILKNYGTNFITCSQVTSTL